MTVLPRTEMEKQEIIMGAPNIKVGTLGGGLIQYHPSVGCGVGCGAWARRVDCGARVYTTLQQSTSRCTDRFGYIFRPLFLNQELPTNVLFVLILLLEKGLATRAASCTCILNPGNHPSNYCSER
eukprot:gene9396-biopygen6437